MIADRIIIMTMASRTSISHRRQVTRRDTDTLRTFIDILSYGIVQFDFFKNLIVWMSEDVVT